MIGVPPILTVDLARLPDAKVWHILRRGADNPQVTLCAIDLPEDATVEEDIDAHVVQLFGKPVCSRCRRRLQ